MKTYSEKLRNPLWQRKRLEIMKRDGFECKCCLDCGNELHVHHLRYEKGIQPWDYDNDDLITLCLSCHEAWHLLDNCGIDWSQIYLVSNLHNELEWQSIRKFMKSKSDV